MSQLLYPALIHKQDDSAYGVSFPDFPGCISAGDTLDQAKAMAAEALAFHIEGLQQDGVPLPAPSTLEAARHWKEESMAQVLIEVPIQVGRKVRRINVTIDERLLAQIDQAAVELGMSRSAFITTGARMLMAHPEPVRKKAAGKRR